MNILVVGASKGIGRDTVKTALERGHDVTAFARHTEKIGLEHPKLRLVDGDVLNVQALRNAMEGQEAVICTLGLPTLKALGPPFAKRTYVLSAGTSNILEAMHVLKIKRLLCVTAIGSGDSVAQCTGFAKIAFRYGLRWLFKEKDRQESLIKQSNLQWTIIRPTALTHGRQKGAKVGEHLRSGLLTPVSRADVASTMLDLINKPGSFKKALVVSYGPHTGDTIRWVTGYLGFR